MASGEHLWVLGLAGLASRSPEIDQYIAAPQAAQRHGLSVQVSQGKVWGEGTDFYAVRYAIVHAWVKAWPEGGLAGLAEGPRSSRPPKVSDEVKKSSHLAGSGHPVVARVATPTGQ